MTPAHFPKMLGAELRCVFGRASAKAAIALGVFIGIIVAFGFHWGHGQMLQAEINGLPAQSFIDFSLRGVTGRALWLRNFFALPMVLILATASAFAGERGDNTLREVFVRPVPRWSVLLAKVLALMALSLCTLVATFVPSLVGGLMAFGADKDISEVLMGYGVTWVSDLGLILIVVLASGFTRSVGGVVVAVLGYLMFDLGVQAFLTLLKTFGVEWADTAASFVPGNALGAWDGYLAQWEVSQFVGLGLLILVAGTASVIRYERMDVP